MHIAVNMHASVGARFCGGEDLKGEKRSSGGMRYDLVFT